MNNSLSAEQMNPIYEIFKEPGFHWGLFLPALFFAILAMIGIPLNASVCWVTIKHRSSLGFNTCILLAIDSFFEILYQLGHFNFLIIAASGINFYPLRLALPIQIYSVIGLFADITQVSLLSFDRLFSVLAPLFYRQLNQRIYIFCHLLINAGISVFYFSHLIPSTKNTPEWPCTGQIENFISLPSVGPIFWYFGLSINCSSILSYLLVAILIRLKTEMATEKQQKIYRSLFLIVLINIIAYFYGIFLHLLFKLSLFPLTPLQIWYFKLFTCTFFLNIGVMSNAPILYFNSMDYRNAYKKEFKKLIQMFKRICGRQEQSTIKITPISNHINIK